MTKESPCGHGRVICFSIYGGPDIHFGAEPPTKGAPRQDQLWVDTMLGNNEVSALPVRRVTRPKPLCGPSLRRTQRLTVAPVSLSTSQQVAPHCICICICFWPACVVHSGACLQSLCHIQSEGLRIGLLY